MFGILLPSAWTLTSCSQAFLIDACRNCAPDEPFQLDFQENASDEHLALENWLAGINKHQPKWVQPMNLYIIMQGITYAALFYLHGWSNLKKLNFHAYEVKLEDPWMMIPNHLFGINPLDSVHVWLDVKLNVQDMMDSSQPNFPSEKSHVLPLDQLFIVDKIQKIPNPPVFCWWIFPLFPSPNPPTGEDTAFKLAQEITSSADEVVQSFRCAPGLLSAMIIIAQCAAGWIDGGWMVGG